MLTIGEYETNDNKRLSARSRNMPQEMRAYFGFQLISFAAEVTSTSFHQHTWIRPLPVLSTLQWPFCSPMPPLTQCPTTSFGTGTFLRLISKLSIESWDCVSLPLLPICHLHESRASIFAILLDKTTYQTAFMANDHLLYPRFILGKSTRLS